MREGSRGDSKERDKKDAKGEDKAEDEAFDPTNLDKVRLSLCGYTMIYYEYLRNSELILNGCNGPSLNGHRPVKVGEDKEIIYQSQIRVFVINIWEIKFI